MAKEYSGFALKTFNDGDTAEEKLVKRGDKFSTDDQSRWKDLKAAGLVGDKPPERPSREGQRSPQRRFTERQPRRTQERDGRRTQEEGDPTDAELEDALDVFKRAGLAHPDMNLGHVRDGMLAVREGRAHAVGPVEGAAGVTSPNAHGLVDLGPSAAAGEGRTQRADESGQGDGTARAPEPTPEELAAGAKSAGETAASREAAAAASAAGQEADAAKSTAITTGDLAKPATDATAGNVADAKPTRATRGNRSE